MVTPLLWSSDLSVFSPLSIGSGLSLRLGHLKDWVLGWAPRSVYSLGSGLSSVEAWFSTALDIEEVLSAVGEDQLHIMVADVYQVF